MGCALDHRKGVAVGSVGKPHMSVLGEETMDQVKGKDIIFDGSTVSQDPLCFPLKERSGAQRARLRR